jgi:hypothetical protein
MSSVASVASPTLPTTTSAASGPASPTSGSSAPSAGPPGASRFGEVLAGGASAPATAAASAAVPAAGPGLLDVLAHGARHVAAAGGRLDQALARVRKGRVGPEDLVKLQADVYEASMSLQLAGKLVEKSTTGIKQVLQTQV